MGVKVRLAWIALAATVLASCTGGADGGIVPSAGQAQNVAAARTRVHVKAYVRIHIPKRRRHRHARYVSPSTKAITFMLAGPTNLTKVAGLTTSSPNCTPGTSGTVCTISLDLRSCPTSADCYSGSVVAYDNVSCTSSCIIPVGSKALSEQSVAFNVAVGKPNVLSLTLDGVPATAGIVPGPSSTLDGTNAAGFTLSKCVVAPQSVQVAGYDPDGNQIVGPGAPDGATIASDDTTHLAVATPKPSASPQAFSLVPPAALAAATIPNYHHVVHLTVSVTPLSGTGSTQAVSSAVNVTFNGDICGVLSEYPLVLGADPLGITTGPDGDIWFTEGYSSKIGKMPTDATPGSGSQITEYSVPNSLIPRDITAGTDGNLWFADCFKGYIGKVTPSGTITEYSNGLTTSGPKAIQIVERPSDDTMWATQDQGNGSLISTGVPSNGTLAETQTLTASSQPFGITLGPDGNVWFTENNTSKIGVLNSSNGITEYTTKTSSSNPDFITAGPDGALWFTETCGANVGRITTDGKSTEYALPTGATRPYGIVAAPDGALWFAIAVPGEIGRVTTDGSITIPTITPAISGSPYFITTGPDGALWFFDGNNLARVQ